MKKITGYSEEIKINNNYYTVMLIKKGTGMKTSYASFLCGEEVSYFLDEILVHQQYMNPPKDFTVEEIMDSAIGSAYDQFGNLNRLERVDAMFMEYLDEVDERREWMKKVMEKSNEKKYDPYLF